MTAITTPSNMKSARVSNSAFNASRIAFNAMLLRDLTVLKKDLAIFIARTLIQPFLLVSVFLYVFPQISQGIGGEGGHSSNFQFYIAGPLCSLFTLRVIDTGGSVGRLD